MAVRNKKILIVEDDNILTKLLSSQFSKDGITVINASNGKEGLAKLLSNHPDLVILDIIMPEENGFKMLDNLYEIEPGNKTPIIILSNSQDIHHITEAKKKHVSTYLLKTDQKLQKIIEIVEEKLSSL